MANQQFINIGSQPNDGTGDSIYVAMQKINSNFNDLYTLLGFGAGFTFLRMKEAPAGPLVPNALLQINPTGNRFQYKTLVAGTGMDITLTSSTIQIINTASNLKSDRNPTLSADLQGQNAFSLVNMDNTGPHADYDAVSRKWVYENFVNRDGVTRYDTTSSLEFFAGGKSTIRGNISLLTTPGNPQHIVNKDYVDSLVDRSGYASKVNFFVSNDGDDARFDLPSSKRGRAFAYAFKTVNRAARAAEQFIYSGKVDLGVYQKTITMAGNTINARVSEVSSSEILSPNLYGIRLRVTLDPSSINNGTDPYIAKSIFPGNFIVGKESEAVGEINAIELDTANGYEYYHIAPVDYAKYWNVPVTPDDFTNSTATTFTLGLGDAIDIPDFWVGYKFVVTNESYNIISYGTITGINTTYDDQGNAVDTITVDFRNGVQLTSNSTIDAIQWHVYSADFVTNEELIWGQKQIVNQSSINIESGVHLDQYPIKVSDNTSLRGDEFRRTILSPAPLQGTKYPGVSSSKWANTYFYRDAQVDGIITAQLTTTTDYASAVSITADSINNDPITETVTFELASGLADAAWVGKVFQTDPNADADAVGEIRSVNNNTFEVCLAQNRGYIREISNYTVGSESIPAGDWHIYDPVKYGYHYLRDSSRAMNVLNTLTNYGGHNFAALSLEENKEFIQEEVVEYIDATYPSSYDRDKLFRNTKLAVDAIVLDLLFTDDSQSNFTGISFWDSGSYAGTLGITTTTNTFNYVASLAQKIITDDTSGTRYQSTVTQTVTGNVSDADSRLVVGEKFSLITDILENGPGDTLGRIVSGGISPSTNAGIQTAYANLQANKAYIQTEAIAFVEATKEGAITYNQTTLYDYIGYIIDAVCFDSLYSGNVQSVMRGYYIYSHLATSAGSPLGSTATIAAYNHLKSIIPDIIEGTPITTRYQESYNQVTQGTKGTSTESTVAQSKIDIITNIVANGPNEVVSGERQPISLTMSGNTNVQGAATILRNNRSFIAAEVIAYIDTIYNTGFIYDREKCRRDIGLIVDALVYDLRQSGWTWTVNAADSYRSVAEVKQNQLTETLAGIEYVWTIGQTIIQNQPVLTVRNINGIEQNIDEDRVSETDAGPILRDLINMMKGIIGNDPDYNPAKYNDQLDVLLMNDGTINRYISAQGHGGFMKVLDPDGQILAKSPYTQTASSFSKSYNRPVFSGGMLVDGFAGNTKAIPASVSNDTNGDPIIISVTATGGLGRPSIIPNQGYIKPQTPCFFVHRGVTYQVSFIGNYDPEYGTGLIYLNPLTSGGIYSVTNEVATGFRTGATRTIPIRITAPTRTGGQTSTGTAVINSSGAITSIDISFPGSGYETGSYSYGDDECPNIAIGGAKLSWTLDSNGSVVGYTIINAGEGYAVGTPINFPTSTGVTAAATVASVGSSGEITGITITTAGDSYTSDPAVTFGGSLDYDVVIKPGFIVTASHPLPSEVVLITAGNRSMLANDFTQMNDLGYGVFATNGGLIENVSMFTYYCRTSYYALNGAILRTLTGSSAYGEYGLIAEGSDPNEVPIAITNKYSMNQIATVNSVGTYTNADGDFTIYVDGLDYPPLPQSQIEINHKGIVQNYNVKSAIQDTSDSSVYSLSIDDGQGQGLVDAVDDGTPVTIRLYYNQSLLGVNPNTLTRPSTVLTYNEDPSVVYRILSYTDLGGDTALAEGNTPYNYINLNPWSEGGLYRQGLGEITITNGGSGYTPSSTVTAVIPAPSTAGTATVNGTVTNTDLITISGAANTIMVGSRVTLTSGGGDPNGAPTYVLWVNSAKTQVRVNRNWTWTNGTGLTFSGVQATGYGVTNASGVITSIVLTNQGAGYANAATVRNITFASGSATATAYPVGIAGSDRIKVVDLDAAAQARIASGLTGGYYYTFGFEGDLYKITGYTDSATTGNEWGEVTAVRVSDSAALQYDILTSVLKAGITADQPGGVTSKISTLRATSHDMVDVGTGGYADTRYPNDLYGPSRNPPDTSRQTKEIGKGRVYFVTADQDGNFKVGPYFSVDQGRGTVSISAPISLTNVDGISFKRGQTLVQQFSVDGTMGNNSNSSVPTERAIVSYVNSRLGLNRNNTTAGVSPIGNGFLDLGGVLEMKANVKMGGYRVTNMGDPVGDQDAVTKKFVQDTYVNTSGDTMIGPLSVSPNNTFWIGTATSKWSEIHATSFRGNADTASKWATARTVTFTGDVTGSFSIDGSADVTSVALTVGADKVALGTDTTGNYVQQGATSGYGLSGSVNSEGGTFTVSSNGTSTNTAGTLVFRNDSGDFAANIATLTATQARYADLAEKYLPDNNYEPGTVVVFGGGAEITVTTEFMDRRVAGIISTNPAYMMNSEQAGGVFVALQGRVPCKVIGKIKKGDMLVTSGTPGVAIAEKNPALGSVIGKALENYDSNEVGIIEVVAGRI